MQVDIQPHTHTHTEDSCSLHQQIHAYLYERITAEILAESHKNRKTSLIHIHKGKYILHFMSFMFKTIKGIAVPKTHNAIMS